MFTHLLRFDEDMIQWAQWMVRQIELYTSMSRKLVVKISFGFTTSTLCILFVVAGLAKFSDMALIFVFFYFLLCCLWLREQFYEFKKNTPQGQLPASISLRRISRFYCWWVALLWAHVEIVALAELSLSFAQLLFFVCITSQLYMLLLQEYLLCTTSLPPGEKEKRKQERATRNVAPNAG